MICLVLERLLQSRELQDGFLNSQAEAVTKTARIPLRLLQADAIWNFRRKGISKDPWTLEGDTASPEQGHCVGYEQLHTTTLSCYTD